MALLNVCFSTVLPTTVGTLQLISLNTDALAAENVATSGVAAATVGAAGARHKVVRVCSDLPVYIAIGLNPTAVVGAGPLIPAYTPEYFSIEAGHKVSVVNAP